MESKNKLKKSFIILNDKGLHTRPATELVKCASAFESQIFLVYQGLNVNAKCLLSILMLAVTRGAKIEIDAEGIDAEDAVAAIIELASAKFNIQ
ncbi:MAG: HPr family phosphocarrier protein [Candidatus Neptunochlamydia sp.]|nr:HPr family phosphocarrier protein [Candidatus Neptunochlamydia sp.]